jgi:hypothetical protein
MSSSTRTMTVMFARICWFRMKTEERTKGEGRSMVAIGSAHCRCKEPVLL